MTGKKTVKYCRIFKWIEDRDAELSEAIRDLCMEGALAPNRSINGITFLMPSVASPIRKDIVTKAYTKDADEAVRLIESLIIPDIFTSVNDFVNAKRPIGNKLGVKFTLDKSSKNEVHFKEFKIRLTEPNFSMNTLHKKENIIAVWDLIDGSPPVTGDSYNAPKPVRPKQVEGGDPACETEIDRLASSYRAKFAESIELKFLDKIRTFNTRINNPYLAIVLKLLKYLSTEHVEEYIKIKPILDIDPIITFYILFEPYKTNGDYLISGDILSENVLKKVLTIGDFIDAAADYKAYINQQIQMDEVQIFSNPVSIINNVQVIRGRLLNEVAPRDLKAKIIEIYNTFETNNRINGITPILPKSLHMHYAANHNKRLWQDEYRFIVGECIRSMNAEPDVSTKINIFNNVCNTLKLQIPGNNYSKELTVMNEKEYELTVCLKDKIRIMQYFINSTDFLFCSSSVENFSAMESVIVPTAPAAIQLEIPYNRSSSALYNLNSVKMVQPHGIDPKVAQKVIRYMEMGKTIDDFKKAADGECDCQIHHDHK
jgi:hypothetical protein